MESKIRSQSQISMENVDDYELEEDDRQIFFEQEQIDVEEENVTTEADTVHEIQFTVRHCGVCREPGHDRRTCEFKDCTQILQLQSTITKVLLGEWRGFLFKLHWQN